jgi:glutamine amidotransferase
VIVAVVDYRAGNLASVVKALSAVGAEPRVVERSAGLSTARAIVIPGVGHFEATRTLNENDRQVIRERISAGVPVLGICLGMQWLFEGSEEAPDLPGLGVFVGRCEHLNEKRRRVSFSSEDAAEKDTRRLFSPPISKVPHVGWNTLELTGRPSRLLADVTPGSAAYFTHSYSAPVGDDAVACTTHIGTFASVVERGRVFGTQFHPEKSGAVGLRMLRRFIEVAEEAGERC